VQYLLNVKEVEAVRSVFPLFPVENPSGTSAQIVRRNVAESGPASSPSDYVPDCRPSIGSWGKTSSVFDAMVIAFGRAAGSASANETRIGGGFISEQFSVFIEIAPERIHSLRA